VQAGTFQITCHLGQFLAVGGQSQVGNILMCQKLYQLNDARPDQRFATGDANFGYAEAGFY
jgi:hypothetical protein